MVWRVGWVLVAGAVVGVAWFGWRALATDVRITGLREGEAMTPTALTKRDIAVTVGGSRVAPTVSLNGHALPVDGRPALTGGAVHVRLPTLVDGTYRLSVTTARKPFGHQTTTRRFEVDGTPPAIGFSSHVAPVSLGRPVELTGTVAAGDRLVVPGAQVQRAGDKVTLRFARPPLGAVSISATDAAGNRARTLVSVPVAYPRTNAVHVGPADWADPTVKAGILAMAASHRINAVVLDLKDEQGVIGYDSKVPLARRIGAVRPVYDLPAAVAELHAAKVRVIGRVAAFADPVLARAAWAAGNKDWVLQTPSGTRLDAYGGFTNYVRPEVRAYNIDIATEAAKLGVDDILWDYVQRPEGAPTTMVVPGLKGLSSAVIADFLRQGQAALRPLGVYQGADVFGIAATRPQSIAQDVPAMAQHVDYLAPMLYPERWGLSEYGVADPMAQPYDIVSRSLADFQKAVAPFGRPLAPWLEDYGGRVAYGPPQVQAQIKAATDRHVANWMFWNPHGRYSVAGYPAGS